MFAATELTLRKLKRHVNSPHLKSRSRILPVQKSRMSINRSVSLLLPHCCSTVLWISCCACVFLRWCSAKLAHAEVFKFWFPPNVSPIKQTTSSTLHILCYGCVKTIMSMLYACIHSMYFHQLPPCLLNHLPLSQNLKWHTKFVD